MTLPASVHGKNVLVLAVALAGAAPFGWRALGSLALGGAMQVLNLRGLERSVATMLGLAALGRPFGRGLVTMRWLLFLGAVVAALVALPLDPLAFLVGLSTSVPAVIWHGLATARPRPEECR